MFNTLSALILILVIIIILYLFVATNEYKKIKKRRRRRRQKTNEKDSFDINPDVIMPDNDQKKDVYDTITKLYRSSEVDPLITGQLYAPRDYLRYKYDSRIVMPDMAEYNSSGTGDAIGVDMGPYGTSEYGGRIIGADDGIPKNWQFPSTPMRQYKAKGFDYYDINDNDVKLSTDKVYTYTVPDHDPKIGGDDDFLEEDYEEDIN